LITGTHKLQNKLIKSLVLFALIQTHSLANSAETVKIGNAVESAVATNPEVLQIYNTYESVLREQAASIGANFVPSVDYTYGAGNDIRNDPLTTGAGGLNTPKNFGRTNQQIAIRQNIFNGFSSLFDVKRLDYTARAKLFEVENTSQQVANNTSKAYIDLVRNRILVSLAEDNYVALKTLYEQLKLKADAGVAKKSDVEQAQSRLSLADYNLTVEGSNLHDNEARYQRLVGSLPPKELDTNFAISKEIPTDISLAMTKAQSNNPSIVASFEDINAQNTLSRQKLSPFLPRIDVKAFKDRNTNQNGIDGVFENQGMQVDFTFNLFRGGADANLYAKEAKLYDAALDKRDRVCRDVREQLQIGFNDVRKYTEQVAYLDQRQISIEKARDAYRKQFEINQRSLIDLLNAENELFEAKRAYTNAFHELAIAYVRTHTQMGTILEALNVRRPQKESLPAITGALVDGMTCPALAPTPYKPDHKFLDQRAIDNMVQGTQNNTPPADATTKKSRKAKPSAELVPAKPASNSVSLKEATPTTTGDTASSTTPATENTNTDVLAEVKPAVVKKAKKVKPVVEATPATNVIENTASLETSSPSNFIPASPPIEVN
jgi:adhesin transport system outer membrane protein